jgi:hypothetical protein
MPSVHPSTLWNDGNPDCDYREYCRRMDSIAFCYDKGWPVEAQFAYIFFIIFDRMLDKRIEWALYRDAHYLP